MQCRSCLTLTLVTALTIVFLYLNYSYTSSTQYSLNTKSPIQTKVLIQSAPRSGSTFLEALLSFSPNALHIFEPLRWIRPENPTLTPPFNKQHKSLVSPTLQAVFECGQEWLRKVKVDVTECLKAEPLIVKTVRLRRDEFEEWAKLDVDSLKWLKVIHIVRDPRGRYHSLIHKGSVFSSVIVDFKQSCLDEMEDLTIKNLLPQQNYYLVRYEDLVSGPLLHLKDMYAFMGQQFGEAEEKLLLEHIAADDTDQNSKGYFGTHRSKDFDPNKWMRELHIDDIRKVESVCGNVMQIFGYDTFQAES